jgi:hypothetical protein
MPIKQNGGRPLENRTNWSVFLMQNGRQSIQKLDSKSIRKMTIPKLDGPDFVC